jgi:hypothetical protein
MAENKKFVPLHLSGNTTEQQNSLLMLCLEDALSHGFKLALGQLDRQSIQAAIESGPKIRAEFSQAVAEIVLRHAVSDKFKNEEIGSKRTYPKNYNVRPIEAQVSELRKAFPALGGCQEKLGHMALPDEPEGWFAIPRWQALAPTYNEAVEIAMNALATKRKLSHRIAGRLGNKYLRQSERTRLAETVLADQQQGNDIFVVAAQFGMLHRGSSARRTRARLASHEFALGAFAVVCMLITHPERLSTSETLMIDCGGDEYSLHADLSFDRVPLFDFDLSGIEFSIYYEDRAWDMWGTPTGFLYKLVEEKNGSAA